LVAIKENTPLGKQVQQLVAALQHLHRLHLASLVGALNLHARTQATIRRVVLAPRGTGADTFDQVSTLLNSRAKGNETEPGTLPLGTPLLGSSGQTLRHCHDQLIVLRARTGWAVRTGLAAVSLSGTSIQQDIAAIVHVPRLYNMLQHVLLPPYQFLVARKGCEQSGHLQRRLHQRPTHGVIDRRIGGVRIARRLRGHDAPRRRDLHPGRPARIAAFQHRHAIVPKHLTGTKHRVSAAARSDLMTEGQA
jgi:hypothetical protein